MELIAEFVCACVWRLIARCQATSGYNGAGHPPKVKSPKDKRSMSVASGTKRKEGGVGESIRLLIHALIIALVIRTFLFQPFNIPSGSMKATLLVGDYLFVSKFSYGYSHYSLPLSPPLFSGRIMGSKPERGDIVVFRLPKDDSTDYIKRVIGLPGDRIQMIEGVLHINGTPVKRERVDDFVDIDEAGRTTRVKRWRETLPNGVSYRTLDLPYNLQSDNTDVYHVPTDNYFMMGDNRAQLDRQPLPAGRLCAVREHRRPRADHLLLGGRGRARLGSVALALDGALEPAFHDRAMRRASANAATHLHRRQRSDANAGAAASKPQNAAKRTQVRPQTRGGRERARADHRLSLQGPRAAGRALTHISALAGGSRAGSYQRLEFLGDHVLGLIISDMLFRAFPKGDEGELSRRLADLVRRETCADVARAIDLGEALRLGTFGIQRRRPARTAILADVCEALVGAVFLDGGYPAATELVERLWGERMRAPARPLRDPEDHAAGMGAGARPADPGLSRGRAHRPASQSGIPRRRDVAGPRAGRGTGPLQARRRASRRRRHADSAKACAVDRLDG